MIGNEWDMPLSTTEIRTSLAGDERAQLSLETFYGRPLRRRAVEEIWRLWPTLPAARRERVRELFWVAGITGRLAADAARRRGARRHLAFNRLMALADPRILGPLLASWPRLSGEEQNRVLALAGQADYPKAVHLLWHQVAARAADPFGEMARLVRTAGGGLTEALGTALAGEDPVWAWETLIRLGTRQADQVLVGLLGRRDSLGDRTKQYFSAASGQHVLALLMEAARFHPSWETRIGAVMVLLGRKEPQALRFLTELLRDQSWYEEPGGLPPGKGRRSWPVLLGLQGFGSLSGQG